MPIFNQDGQQGVAPDDQISTGGSGNAILITGEGGVPSASVRVGNQTVTSITYVDSDEISWTLSGSDLTAAIRNKLNRLR